MKVKQLLKTYETIASTTEQEAKEFAIKTVLNYKETFNVYIVDLGNHYGISRLAYQNGRLLYHANAYALHYGRNKTTEELMDYYMKTADAKLFSDVELWHELKNYKDYRNKIHFVINYLPLAYDTISMYDEDYKDKRSKYPYHCLFTKGAKSKAVADYINGHFARLEEKHYKKLENDETYFLKAVSYELANHEAGFTGEVDDGLRALGLSFDELPISRQLLVISELKSQMSKLIKK